MKHTVTSLFLFQLPSALLLMIPLALSKAALLLSLQKAHIFFVQSLIDLQRSDVNLSCLLKSMDCVKKEKYDWIP